MERQYDELFVGFTGEGCKHIKITDDVDCLSCETVHFHKWTDDDLDKDCTFLKLVERAQEKLEPRGFVVCIDTKGGYYDTEVGAVVYAEGDQAPDPLDPGDPPDHWLDAHMEMKLSHEPSNFSMDE